MRVLETFMGSVALAALALSSGQANAQSTQSSPPPPMRDSAPSIRSTTTEAGLGSGTNTTEVQNAFAPNRDTVRSMTTYSEMLKVARCLAARAKGQVIDALEAAPGSPLESRRYSRTYEVFQTCGPQHTPILSLQRGSWSETMYLKQHPQPLSGEGKGDAGRSFAEAEKVWNVGREAADQTMIAATNCLVAARPSDADAILRSAHGSEMEATLMDQIFMRAPQCAGASRPTDLSRTFLRAFLADSLYRAAEGGNKLAIFGK